MKVLLHLSLGVSSLHAGISGSLLGNAASMTSPWGRQTFTGKLTDCHLQQE